jgi:hypothetical protein
MNEVDHARKTFLAILPKNPNKMHVFLEAATRKDGGFGLAKVFFYLMENYNIQYKSFLINK